MIVNSDSPVKRTIRSFVRREGRMTSAQKSALTELWPKYGLEPSDLLDFEHIFQRHAPTWLEVGFGMGDALVAMAKQHPESNFIGIEVYRPGVASTLRHIEEHSLDNVRIISQDAVEILKKFVNDASLAAILIFFPDPWPKQRHQKRRLIQSEFVELLSTKLNAGGKLCLATDWQDYAKQMLKVVSQCQSLYNPHADKPYAPRPEFRPLTKFERRGQRLGHGVWDLTFHRKS